MADYTLSARLTADTSAFRKGFQKAQESIAGLQNKVLKTGQTVKEFGKDMTKSGAKMSVGITAPLALMTRSIANTGMEFESSMSKVSALSGATGKEFEKLEKQARDLGATTIFSAGEAADGMAFLAMAGFDTNQILDTMPGLLDLAASSGMDLGRSADIATNILSAFGMEAAEASRVADVLAKGASSANTSVEQLGGAMQYVAPVAASLGLEIEGMTAAVGLMSDAGIQGEQAGRQLRQGLLRLASPTGSAADLIEELGINAFNADGTMKELYEVVGELEKGLGEMDDQARTAALSTIFGAESVAGWTALLSQGATSLKDYTGELENAEGAAASMAEVMQDNLQGRLVELRSSLEELQLKVYEALLPTFEKVVSVFQNVSNWLNNLSPEAQRTIILVAGIAAAIGPLLLGLGMFTSLIGVAITGLGMLISPIGLIIAGIVGLGIAFGTAMIKSEEFRNIVMGVFEKIKEIATSLYETISPILSNLFEKGIEGAKNFANGIGDKLLNAFELISDVVTTVIDVIGQFLSSVISGFSEAGGEVKSLSALFIGFNPVIKVAMMIIKDFGPQLVASFQEIARMAMPILNLLGKTLGQLAAAIIPLVMNVISTLIPIIVQLGTTIMSIVMAVLPILLDLFTQLVPVVMSLVTTVIDLVSQLLPLVSIVIDALVPVIMVLVEAILNIVTAVAPALIAILQAIIAVFSAIIPVVVAVLTTVVEVMANIISAIAPIIAFVAGVISNIISIIAPIVSFIAGVIASIFNVISPIIAFTSGVFTTIFSIVSSIWRGIMSFISGMIGSISSIISSLSGTVSSIFNNIFGTVTKVMGRVRSTITNVFSAIRNAWSGLTGMVSNIFSGISGSVEKLVDQVKRFINGVIGGINAAIGIINKIPGVKISKIPQLQRGTDDWTGGFAYMNEGGRGELVLLPDGSQVIPHDVSMRYAREAGRQMTYAGRGSEYSTVNNENIVTIHATIRSDDDIDNLATKLDEKLSELGSRREAAWGG